MSRDKMVEPEEVVREVDHFVSKCYHDVENSSNVTLLDSGQVFSLHLLAASVYATGYRDGTRSEAARHDGERQREFDARRDGRNAVARIERAREALAATGYFTDGETGDDIAPRITELWSAVTSVLSLAGDLLAMVETPQGRDAAIQEHGVNRFMDALIRTATEEHRRNAMEHADD